MSTYTREYAVIYFGKTALNTFITSHLHHCVTKTSRLKNRQNQFFCLALKIPTTTTVLIDPINKDSLSDFSFSEKILIDSQPKAKKM
jgi:hypothetical protein